MYYITTNGISISYRRQGRFYVAADGFRTMKFHRMKKHLSGDRFPAHKNG